jgi:hypothetical protein
MTFFFGSWGMAGRTLELEPCSKNFSTKLKSGGLKPGTKQGAHPGWTDLSNDLSIRGYAGLVESKNIC